MIIDFQIAPMIGHWDVDASTSQCEFQFGTQLIYVQHPKGSDPRPYLQAAQAPAQLAWDDSKNAIAHAERWFRAKHPDFWRCWDNAVNPKHPLIFYAISFYINDPRPHFDIACDPTYEFTCVRHDELWGHLEATREALPHIPTTDRVIVRRLADQTYELV
ncbi:hypothetical protein FXN63_22210 [Pigmentiphaga aceris]|uniref:Uncharacterized protein n=1 Tax=Pigmentiphaga aceris TaxID=1940612 RepID=A0A5C0B0V3_9BURK|nr:hypothetical protein [Pigmentiphaga aceris]QEI08248.1 hypothetical protein FXN63_22210 [Pigmentiphaga aceris]